MKNYSTDNPKSILIVDDEVNIVISLAFLLEKEGFQVQTAANGAEALQKYTDHKPEIILLDVMMPIMNGYETARKIRSIDVDSATRILFLTARGTQEDRQEGYVSGADDFIVKPFDNEEILNKIREFL